MGGGQRGGCAGVHSDTGVGYTAWGAGAFIGTLTVTGPLVKLAFLCCGNGRLPKQPSQLCVCGFDPLQAESPR